MKKSDYQRIVLNVDRTKSPLPTFGIVCIDAVLAIVGAFILTNGIVGYLLAQTLFALVFFHGFTFVHEAAHGNVSRSPSINLIMGLLGSIMSFMPFASYKLGHLDHHRWSGNIVHDPVTKQIYSVLRCDTRGGTIFALCWRLWIPVVALCQNAVLLFYFLKYFGKDWKKCVHCLSSTLLILLVLYYIRPLQIVPAYFVFVLALELINFPHHFGMPYFGGETMLPIWEQERVTRSCSFPKWVAALLFLNFNLHTEHHLFPWLPWYRLEKVRDYISGIETYSSSKGIEWDIKSRCRPPCEMIIGRELFLTGITVPVTKALIAKQNR